MKHLFSLTVVFLLFISTVGASVEFSLLSTSVRLTVLSSLGNVVENAKVILYETREDYDKEENSVAGPTFTDEKGRVTFKNLKEKVYYVQVTKGDDNNYGDGEQTGKLIKGRVNKFNIVIQ